MAGMLRGWACHCPGEDTGNMAENLILGVWGATLAILGVPPSEEVLLV